MLDEILTLIDDLRVIDYGYLETVNDEEREAALTYLETIADELEYLGLDFPEADLAIHFFLTDPERSRTYLYGPTDIQDGVGLIEKLKQLAVELTEE